MGSFRKTKVKHIFCSRCPHNNAASLSGNVPCQTQHEFHFFHLCPWIQNASFQTGVLESLLIPQLQNLWDSSLHPYPHFFFEIYNAITCKWNSSVPNACSQITSSRFLDNWLGDLIEIMNAQPVARAYPYLTLIFKLTYIFYLCLATWLMAC